MSDANQLLILLHSVICTSPAQTLLVYSEKVLKEQLLEFLIAKIRFLLERISR